MSCSTLQCRAFDKVIILTQSTPQTLLFAEDISLHLVKAEEDKIAFLCSYAVSEQVMCTGQMEAHTKQNRRKSVLNSVLTYQ